MKTRTISLRALGALAIGSLSLTGCIDDNYDLDDLDKEYAVKIDNLVVPINLDEIELSTVIDLDEDDPDATVKIVNGQYAVVVDGDFESDPIKVDPVTITGAYIEPINTKIYQYSGADVNLPTVEVGQQAVSYEVTPETTEFNFDSSDVDKSIRSIDVIKGAWTVDINLTLHDTNHIFNTLDFQSLVLTIPSGMHVTNYKYENGLVYVGDLSLSNGQASVTLDVDQITTAEFPAGDYTFTTHDDANGTVKLEGKVGVQSGYVIGVTNATSSDVPQDVNLDITPTMSNLQVKKITGTIDYSLDSFDVDDVELNDLPDFLSQDGTNITITNPQLYIKANNPMAAYKLEGSTGLSISAIRNGVYTNTCVLDGGNAIVLGYDKGIDGPYAYCLSPSKPDSYYEGFSTAEYLKYSSLGTLLSGDGLPKAIHVDFTNACIKQGKVTDFELDTDLGTVHGDYVLYAPLAFNAGSQVEYADDQTGWDDETISKITINQIKITATATNNLPIDLNLSGYPLDADGKQCVDPETGKVVSLEGLSVKANSTSEVELYSTGTVKGFDGIHYMATGVVPESGSGVVLKPDQTIKLSNIRVTISGSYVDTF